MRLPTVAMAAAFACGILLGLHPAVVRNAASVLLLSLSFAAPAVLILAGILLVRIGRLSLGWRFPSQLGFARLLGCTSAAEPSSCQEMLKNKWTVKFFRKTLRKCWCGCAKGRSSWQQELHDAGTPCCRAATFRNHLGRGG
jgi:hypothetical protein